MTMINGTFGFVFIHIPKCGGTSMTYALSHLTQYNDLEIGGTEFGQIVNALYHRRFGLWKHSFAHEIRSVIGQPLWARYYKFAVVRNPYARAISTYRHLKHRAAEKPFISQFQDF